MFQCIPCLRQQHDSFVFAALKRQQQHLGAGMVQLPQPGDPFHGRGQAGALSDSVLSVILPDVLWCLPPVSRAGLFHPLANGNANKAKDRNIRRVPPAATPEAGRAAEDN